VLNFRSQSTLAHHWSSRFSSREGGRILMLLQSSIPLSATVYEYFDVLVVSCTYLLRVRRYLSTRRRPQWYPDDNTIITHTHSNVYNMCNTCIEWRIRMRADIDRHRYHYHQITQPPSSTADTYTHSYARMIYRAWPMVMKNCFDQRLPEDWPNTSCARCSWGRTRIYVPKERNGRW
jgi:hypothetical protein